MPPPLAPWLHGPDPEALSRGFRIGMALRQARQQERQAADELRFQQEQLKSLNRWRQHQYEQGQRASYHTIPGGLFKVYPSGAEEVIPIEPPPKPPGFERDPQTGAWFEVPNVPGQIPKEVIPPRQKPSERLYRGGQWWEVTPEGGGPPAAITELVPGDTSGPPEPVVEALPNMPGWMVGYNKKNPKSGLRFFNPKGDEVQMTPGQMLRLGDSILARDDKSVLGKWLIEEGARKSGWPGAQPSGYERGLPDMSSEAPEGMKWDKETEQWTPAKALRKTSRINKLLKWPQRLFRGGDLSSPPESPQYEPEPVSAGAALLRQPVMRESAIDTNQIPLSIDAGPYDAMRLPPKKRFKWNMETGELEPY